MVRNLLNYREMAAFCPRVIIDCNAYQFERDVAHGAEGKVGSQACDNLVREKQMYKGHTFLMQDLKMLQGVYPVISF